MLSENNDIKQDFIYYEDENNITRHSAYQYDSMDKFLDMCKKNSVNMDKIRNTRWGE